MSDQPAFSMFPVVYGQNFDTGNACFFSLFMCVILHINWREKLFMLENSFKFISVNVGRYFCGLLPTV